ncbi:hypothetical protein RvY_08711-1 [Ramazzottius varieornatus]|uniref:ABC transporter domain-containing protein n=1 Tax=Ramazzottius varieornatus TaxID=947166 RepID=A0A1D1V9D5_RAMVA|nr:hypothetical protein RvY_08711-1 [Ramazzottius varieornatus]
MDLALPALTVREHLNFHANRRMHRGISPKERKERVEEVILDLGLTKCTDTLIGGRHIKGISGGEMKRLQFGCEVLTDPPLLFCDEPTSGLDSFMAEAVVSIVKNLAARGKTVVCTIHQPSSSVFAVFDKFMLLAEGRVAFLGPRVDDIPFFNSIGIHVPEDYNPADFFVHQLAIIPGHEDECRAKAKEICDKFAVSDLGISMKNRVDELMPDSTANNNRDAGSARYMKHMGHVTYKASYWEQMQAVLWRSVLTMRREPMLLRVRLIQVVIISLIFGLIFLQQTKNMASVQNINGLM